MSIDQAATTETAALIGRYRLLQRVAEGGSASLWVARAEPDGALVAVKLLRGVAANDPRFRREVALLAALSHPNVVGLIDHGVDSARGAWLAMPYVDGLTLRALLARAGRLSPATLGVLLASLLEGLCALHALGLVHRDLKPENVMVTRDGRLVLVDLGLAYPEGASRHTERGAVAGSPQYMSPELIEGGVIGPACDVWAVGVIAYELLTGRRPFHRERSAEEIAAMFAHRYTPLAEADRRVDEALGAWVDGCLHADPRARPADARVLRATLPSALRAAPVALAPASPHDAHALAAATRTALMELVADPLAVERRAADQAIRALAAEADALRARGDLFGAVRCADRAQAWAPDDPTVLALLERSARAPAAPVTRVVPVADPRALVATPVPPTREVPVAPSYDSRTSPPPRTRRAPVLAVGFAIAFVAAGLALVGTAALGLWEPPLAWLGVSGSPPAPTRPAAAARSLLAPVSAAGSAVVAPAAPLLVPSAAPRVAQIAVGLGHACARLEDGGVACWGDNRDGRLGDGTTRARTAPARVAGLSDATQIALGNGHGCARVRDGTVVCWGANAHGQLGTGDTRDRDRPAAVPGLRDVVSVACAGYSSCALSGDGAVRCWGDNTGGRLGVAPGVERCDDSPRACRRVPAALEGLADARAITLGEDRGCAVLRDGAVSCWGARRWTGEPTDARHAGWAPRRVPGLAQVDEVALGPLACARARGAVRCVPARGARPVELADAVQLVASPAVSCAVLRDGAVSCWGGDAERVHAESDVPEPIADLSDAVEVAIGGETACARRRTGVVSCWGQNLAGEFGDGTTAPRATPGPVRFTAL